MSRALGIPWRGATIGGPFGLPAALRHIVDRARIWRAARRRKVEDREALATMSDRDLLDIGVSRASIDDLAAGRWVRDWPI